MREIIVGCMGLGGQWDAGQTSERAQVNEAEALLNAAVDCQLHSFDHADIYKHGRAEAVFGAALQRSSVPRDQLRLQTKCGIRFADDAGPGRYDWSADWIERSVEGSLTRLRTDYIDTLLLHRPDPLAELAEVARTLERLHNAGKILSVGVSNLAGTHMAELQSALGLPIVANQIELHLLHSAAFEERITAGQTGASDVSFTAGTLEYCRRNNVVVQCWGSLCQGYLSGRPLKHAAANVLETAAVVSELAHAYAVPAEAIVLAWLGRHPMGLVPVVGTTRAERLAACARARDVRLSHADWYRLWVAARGAPLP